MWVRGAPLIGAVGAYGLALALDRDASDAALAQAHAALDATRPTAVNLRWALDRVRARGARAAAGRSAPTPRGGRPTRSPPRTSRSITRSASTASRCCGSIAQRKPGPVQRDDPLQRRRARDLRLGHGDGAGVPRARRRARRCTSGCSETRPRLQGANLTAWELAQRGVPHTLCRRQRERRADAPRRRRHRARRRRSRRAQRRRLQQDRHLRQGARRARQQRAVLRRAAVADDRLALATGDAIPIEARDADEVLEVTGRDDYGQATTVAIAPPGTHAVNFAFDVTPARLVTGLRHRARRRAGLAKRGSRRCFPSGSRERAASAGASGRASRGGRRDGARDERRAASIAASRATSARAGATRGSTASSSRRPGLPTTRRAPDDIVADDARRAKRTAARAAVVRVALPSRHLPQRAPTSSAIVHTHAPFATTLACLHRGIPAFHYMVAVAGGRDIRCAPYATFGTQALSDHVARRARRTPRVPARPPRHDRRRRLAAARRSRSRSRSRRWPRCTGARCRSASPRCCPTPRWTSCSRSSRPTDSRGAATR